ncbi:hydroxyisourate hydrolase [Aidingimonas halophila]|uniref:5-hydroxyisourate hydrolase n=1 Tax=Aidingimonas halophila TaxID=574349 RepID=A0A1H2XX58_9GAMM|nr:hydroxyisourate hydrolase [Aidingimonas halophila]GHC29308.1 5-hydroxyisourate hydrolase [Aidingimonas halophila]SDW96939.1 5-hydroxyisourate hydrolase [Aidingimonas halophila]
MGYLTTHVLDTARGRPGEGIRIEIFRLEGERREYLGEVVTNDDGRCDAPLLEGSAFTVGEYELLFHAGDYLDRHQAPGMSPRFLNRIPLRFGVADAGEHYHVPLLLSPFGYSSYRGS